MLENYVKKNGLVIGGLIKNFITFTFSAEIYEYLGLRLEMSKTTSCENVIIATDKRVNVMPNVKCTVTVV